MLFKLTERSLVTFKYMPFLYEDMLEARSTFFYYAYNMLKSNLLYTTNAKRRYSIILRGLHILMSCFFHNPTDYFGSVERLLIHPYEVLA